MVENYFCCTSILILSGKWITLDSFLYLAPIFICIESAIGLNY